MSSGASERARFWRSLEARLGLFYVALFFGSTLLLFALADWATSRSLQARDEATLREEVERQGESLRSGGLSEVAGAAGNERLLLLRVTSTQNRTLLRRGPPSAPKDGELDVPTSSEHVEITRLVSEKSVRWTIASKRVDDAHVVQVGMSEGAREDTLRLLRTGYLWVLGSAALLGLLGGTWWVRRALSPIQQLARVTQQVIDRGDMSARVPLRHSGDQLDALGSLFNEMLARNQRLMSAMREALDHVAHDLRTPLTRLRAIAEIALKQKETEPQREALADVIEESDQVLAMLRMLMDISEAETGMLKLDRQKIDLTDLTRDVVDLYAHVAEEAEIDLRFTASPGVLAIVDGVRLRQALANLVDNAIKHTSAGGHVTLSTHLDGPWARVRVQDDGIGIPRDAQARIWDRLYRADPSRSLPGLGLGLSLVKAITQAHGGSVEVESEPGRGSTFTLSVPAAP